MELFPKFKERGAKEIEMVEGLKKSVVSLCEQMKAKLEAGTYDAIVSDDTGGRIPALLLAEIYKQVSKKKFPTLFVATGKGYRPKNEEDETALTNYLKNGIGHSKKVLLVTQYLRSGDTTDHLIEYLKNSGVEEVEIAAIEDSPVAFDNSDADAIHVGGLLDNRQFGFSENHTILSGISKRREYSPIPVRLDKALETKDTTRGALITLEEYRELAGIEPHDSFEEKNLKADTARSRFNDLEASELSAEERKHIQENINRTRGVIKKLVAEVVEEVWSKKLEA